MKTSLINLIITAFILNTLGPLPVMAQEIRLPTPGMMVHLSPPDNPPVLKGVTVYPDNPFKFDFILDRGQSGLSNDQLKEESKKLVKYFLSSITTPEKDLWVNLSPYEKNRIIPQSFGQTGMGRDLLAEDYILKQITASLIYPEGEIGKQFWKRVYQEAQKKYGTTDIPVNTFNKVWIVPEHAKVYEHGNTAFVVKARLKVMLEQDYLALSRNIIPSNDTHSIGANIIREIVIPQLEKEVNEGKNFAPLRQVYYSLILAVWFKKRMKDSILGQKYMDQNKDEGIHYENTVIPAKAGIHYKNDIEAIYQRYLKAFKKGVYNYIKDTDTPNGVSGPRKYFSGGWVGSFAMNTIDYAHTISSLEAKLPDAAEVTVDLGNSEQLELPFKITPKDLAAQELLSLISPDMDRIYRSAALEFGQKTGRDIDPDDFYHHQSACVFLTPELLKYFKLKKIKAKEVVADGLNDPAIRDIHSLIVVEYEGFLFILDPSWQQFNKGEINPNQKFLIREINDMTDTPLTKGYFNKLGTHIITAMEKDNGLRSLLVKYSQAMSAKAYNSPLTEPNPDPEIVAALEKIEERLWNELDSKTALPDSTFNPQEYDTIGAGGSSTTYRKKDDPDPRIVYKVYPPGAPPGNHVTFQQIAISGLTNLEYLNGNPGIPKVKEWGTLQNGSVWVSMEEIENATSIAVSLDPRNYIIPPLWITFSLSQRLDILARVAEILEAAHKRGISHNDMKPFNILINDLGEVMVIDWDSATALGDRQRAVTRGYRREDEVIMQDQSDVYSLEITMEKCLYFGINGTSDADTGIVELRHRMRDPEPQNRPMMKDLPGQFRELALKAGTFLPDIGESINNLKEIVNSNFLLNSRELELAVTFSQINEWRKTLPKEAKVVATINTDRGNYNFNIEPLNFSSLGRLPREVTIKDPVAYARESNSLLIAGITEASRLSDSTIEEGIQPIIDDHHRQTRDQDFDIILKYLNLDEETKGKLPGIYEVMKDLGYHLLFGSAYPQKGNKRILYFSWIINGKTLEHLSEKINDISITVNGQALSTPNLAMNAVMKKKQVLSQIMDDFEEAFEKPELFDKVYKDIMQHLSKNGRVAVVDGLESKSTVNGMLRGLFKNYLNPVTREWIKRPPLVVLSALGIYITENLNKNKEQGILDDVLIKNLNALLEVYNKNIPEYMDAIDRRMTRLDIPSLICLSLSLRVPRDLIPYYLQLNQNMLYFPDQDLKDQMIALGLVMMGIHFARTDNDGYLQNEEEMDYDVVIAHLPYAIQQIKQSANLRSKEYFKMAIAKLLTAPEINKIKYKGLFPAKRKKLISILQKETDLFELAKAVQGLPNRSLDIKYPLINFKDPSSVYFLLYDDIENKTLTQLILDIHSPNTQRVIENLRLSGDLRFNFAIKGEEWRRNAIAFLRFLVVTSPAQLTQKSQSPSAAMRIFVKTSQPFEEWVQKLSDQPLSARDTMQLGRFQKLMNGEHVEGITPKEELFENSIRNIIAMPYIRNIPGSNEETEARQELTREYQQVAEGAKKPMYLNIPNLLEKMLVKNNYKYLSQKLAGTMLDHLRLHHYYFERSLPGSLMSLRANLSYYREYIDSVSGSRVAKVIFFSQSPESYMEITEFFFVDGEYLGYGHAKLMSRDTESRKQNKLDNVRLLFHIFEGNRAKNGISGRIFEERMREFTALLPEGGRFEILKNQFNKDVAALPFYAKMGFEPEKPALRNVMERYVGLGRIDPERFRIIRDGEHYGDLFTYSLVRPVNASHAQLATQAPGGIDLTARRMDLEVEKDKAVVSQPIDLRELENIQINGLYIKDIEIKPLKNLPQLLGVSAS